ncbi:MAG: hypothetical protein L3J31_06310 [Bacteroidales bacterium]|nr:hypothetical protein [Bacteroidales bacterium]MCF6342402.1 hypothetical protein [Bacteroidales bacterium]
MKHTLFLVILVFVLVVKPLNGQDIPPPNPYININIISGNAIQFIFSDINQYIDGILNGGQSTFIRIGCIADWKLQFHTDQAMFYGQNNPAHTMELNNVGLVVVSTGTNLDDGTNIINYAKTLPLALQSTPVLLLTKGSGSNKGYGLRNAFTLNWEMGTRRGNMNSQTMLEQALYPDIYNLDIILTLSFY